MSSNGQGAHLVVGVSLIRVIAEPTHDILSDVGDW